VASRTSGAAIATQALALNEQEGLSPRNRAHVALLFVGVLVLGLLVAGATHLNMNYHHAITLDGQEQPVNSWGYMWIGDATWGVKDLRSGRVAEPAYSRHGHVALGAAMAAVLLTLCMLMPRWPVHPIGLLMVGTWMGGTAWASICLGWLVKQVVVRYGGARMYRAARPFFLGLIMGEVFAAVVWTIVPVVLFASGQTYKRPDLILLF
jgi:hypothetical protein